MDSSIAKRLAKCAREGAKISGQNGVNAGRMCHDCAFKDNQPHTPDFLEAVEGAMEILGSGRGEFRCHTADHSADNGLPCMGFWWTKLYFDHIDSKD